MSNKIVPGIYRAVIDEVITSIKGDFEKFDVSEDILAELQHKWENKVIQSRVADFEVNTQPQPSAVPPQHQPYPTHPHPHLYPGPHAYAPPTLSHYPHPASGVKTEPMDPRYMLGAQPQMVYAMSTLPGPQINGISRPPAPGGQTGVLSFPPGPPQASTTQNGANGNAGTPGTHIGKPYVPPTAPLGVPSASATPATSTSSTSAPAPAPSTPQSRPQSQPSQSQSSTNSGGGGSGGRIPQLDGPSEDDSDEDSRTPPPLPYVPRSNHPSLPQAPQQSQSSSSTADAEAINSDLDDSDIDDEDDEREEGTGVDSDIVFCTYEKVTRVKNKWRCTFKDGIIHVNGKDYLFAKCNGEFEW
ncbi:transcription factor IIA, alpha/beta subunit [Dendrothele bispora CBS 962.96]|uniref:Transcription factor IIA, alpha/beta subunit n=1 Tax=Dendrothele bispora (strain CBS 962.96) TaxID=1314807 RepID=A0A4S8LQ79_DENBC|nr:transcription factor IIA, alpha/beta subunit [Dendrothele bispora CBS 962.96]